MERSTFVSPKEVVLRAILQEYGGIEGLVYHGFRLTSLTPEQRTEYFRLKREETELYSKIMGFKTEAELEKSKPEIPVDIEGRYIQVQAKIKEIEEIMDKKVPISKEDFLKELYL
jgi:hypothetical protein